jgi:hypothetical protein
MGAARGARCLVPGAGCWCLVRGAWCWVQGAGCVVQGAGANALAERISCLPVFVSSCLGVFVSSRLRVLVSSCLCAFSLCFVAAVAHAEVLDRVLAVVGGEVITLTDVTAAREFGLAVAPANAPDPTRAILTQLIDRELILAEVERYVPPEPAAAAVNEGLRIIRERFPNDEAYRAALERSGIDENHLRETVRQNLRIRTYLSERFVAPPGTPTPPDGRDPQQALIDEWVAGLRRRAAIVDLYVTER